MIIDVEDSQLIKLLRTKFLQQKNRDNYFDFESIRLNNNYNITPKGIIFIYDQYEIASYAEGVVRIFFSFEEIKPFIDKYLRYGIYSKFIV